MLLSLHSMQHMATCLWLVNGKISAPWSSGCSGLLQSSNNTPTTGRNPSHNRCPKRRPIRFNGLAHPAHDACAAVSLPIVPLQLTWLASGRVSQSEWAEMQHVTSRSALTLFWLLSERLKIIDLKNIQQKDLSWTVFRVGGIQLAVFGGSFLYCSLWGKRFLGCMVFFFLAIPQVATGGKCMPQLPYPGILISGVMQVIHRYVYYILYSLLNPLWCTSFSSVCKPSGTICFIG